MSNELEEFKDYLSEFENLPIFDSEVCKVCGIDISSDIAPIVSYKVLLCSCSTDSAFDKVKACLTENNIEYSFTEFPQLKPTEFRVFVDRQSHPTAESLLTKLT
ncbi:MAG: hypothetical protein HND52_17185 [Ignavibacteriae bacterium]|nr:hypothetical protein [Ignavibacteriota bacterium]NOG99696.1 hypothetical protein [Ignavibacteriota bacterium]